MTQENSEMFSACTNGHVRFNEQEEHGTTIALPTTKDEKRVAVSDTDSDADSSDDDVPEEEGLSSAKDTIEEQLRQRESVLQKERELLKEKRKRQNLRFVQQQEEKRQKQEEEKQRKILEFEASLKANEAADEQELEELGDQFFDELEAQASKKISVKPTKINFNDIDYNYTEDVKIELKKQKRKTLKALRRTTMKRGPVKVTVLPSLDNRSFVPKKEEHAVNVKDKWLRRRALKRK